MVGIYKITNLINNKIYIGQSINIQQRWKTHRSGPFNKNNHQYDTPLYRAIRKYGLQNFSFEVLEECVEGELDNKEQYYIEKYDSTNFDKGYNLTKGGDSGSINTLLSNEEILQIYDLLMNSKFTELEIANKFCVSQRYISGINLGQYRIQAGYQYPLKNYRKKEDNHAYCQICGVNISNKGAKLCLQCAAKEKRIVERPTREQLKQEIRENSFLSLGKKYSVSDNAIRKWCKAYDLPTQKSIIKKISNEDWSKI